MASSDLHFLVGDVDVRQPLGTKARRRSKRRIQAVLRQLVRPVHYGPQVAAALARPDEAEEALRDHAAAVLRAFGVPEND
jgi:hypothetical protein